MTTQYLQAGKECPQVLGKVHLFTQELRKCSLPANSHMLTGCLCMCGGEKIWQMGLAQSLDGGDRCAKKLRFSKAQGSTELSRVWDFTF